MQTKTVTIVGLERNGASVALAIQAAGLDLTIIGHDRNHGLAKQAEKDAIVHKAQRNLPRAVEKADILVLTVATEELQETLQIVGDLVQEHTLILDLSSWKQAGAKWSAEYVKQGHYVGAALVLAAEAMSDGRQGQEAASAGLFKNSVFCIMPSVDADPKAVETSVNFGRLLGATPYFVDPLEYDVLVQGVETVPGLLAAAMFSAVHKATGWRDMLRFAGLPFAQTTQPLIDGANIARLAAGNKIATLRWLDSLQAELAQVRSWIESGEEELLEAMLEELRNQREEWLHERAKNDWLEIDAPDMDTPSIARQMFGGFARDRDRDQKD